MEKIELTGYCKYCNSLDEDNAHSVYHAKDYGFPIFDDDALFERFVLEINQAGLSWSTILNKKTNFFNAYDGFVIEKVANYKEKDIERLLSDAGIIRNKLKVNAAIHNANQILALKTDYGSFLAWLNAFHPLSRQEWTILFKKTFKFVGGEIVNEFLMSTGYLKGAHCDSCPTQLKVIKKQPKWLEK